MDRIFSLGPAPCPYPGCGKILRKNRFKQQVFDDLQIEREIDIRKRVLSVHNKLEEDFDLLPEYNKYLEMIENLIYGISSGDNAHELEIELAKFEQENKVQILERNMRESERSNDMAKFQDAMERLRQEKLKLEQKMEIEDEEYNKQQKQELLNKLAHSSMSSEELIQQQMNQALKRKSQRKKILQDLQNEMENKLRTSFSSAKEEAPKTPFTPFKGDRDLHKLYRLLPIPMDIDTLMKGNSDQESYSDANLTMLAKNKEYLAAGWRLHTAVERVMDETFMGLGCIVDREKSLIV